MASGSWARDGGGALVGCGVLTLCDFFIVGGGGSGLLGGSEGVPMGLGDRDLNSAGGGGRSFAGGEGGTVMFGPRRIPSPVVVSSFPPNRDISSLISFAKSMSASPGPSGIITIEDISTRRGDVFKVEKRRAFVVVADQQTGHKNKKKWT